MIVIEPVCWTFFITFHLVEIEKLTSVNFNCSVYSFFVWFPNENKSQNQMDPIQRSVTFFFPLKSNQKHLFTINLYFYTIWRKQQHVNRKSLYSVAMKQKLQKSYIFIYISSAKHTHWKANEKHTNKTVNCNEKKSIAVNILYTHTHTKTHKKSFHDNKCQQNKQQIRLFHFPSHTPTHMQNLFHANVKRVKTNP